MPKREVEFIDYLLVIWDRRWLVCGGTVLFMGLAGGASLLLPEVYESNLDLKVGRVWDTPVEEPQQVAVLMNSDSFLKIVKETLGLRKSVHQMKRDRTIVAEVAGPPTLISVVTRGSTPEEAAGVAQAAARVIIEQHHARFEEQMEEQKRYESELAEKMDEVRKGIERLNAILESHQKQSEVDAPAVILLQAQLEQKELQLMTFAREAMDVRVKNRSTIHSETTRVAFPPVLPERPVKPNVVLNIVLSGLAGALTFSLLAFFLDYLRRARGHGEGPPST